MARSFNPAEGLGDDADGLLELGLFLGDERGYARGRRNAVADIIRDTARISRENPHAFAQVHGLGDEWVTTMIVG